MSCQGTFTFNMFCLMYFNSRFENIDSFRVYFYFSLSKEVLTLFTIICDYLMSGHQDVDVLLTEEYKQKLLVRIIYYICVQYSY